jgi:hypothetical protein
MDSDKLIESYLQAKYKLDRDHTVGNLLSLLLWFRSGILCENAWRWSRSVFVLHTLQWGWLILIRQRLQAFTNNVSALSLIISTKIRLFDSFLPYNEKHFQHNSLIAILLILVCTQENGSTRQICCAYLFSNKTESILLIPGGHVEE